MVSDSENDLLKDLEASQPRGVPMSWFRQGWITAAMKLTSILDLRLEVSGGMIWIAGSRLETHAISAKRTEAQAPAGKGRVAEEHRINSCQRVSPQALEILHRITIGDRIIFSDGIWLFEYHPAYGPIDPNAIRELVAAGLLKDGCATEAGLTLISVEGP